MTHGIFHGHAPHHGPRESAPDKAPGRRRAGFLDTAWRCSHDGTCLRAAAWIMTALAGTAAALAVVLDTTGMLG